MVRLKSNSDESKKPLKLPGISRSTSTDPTPRRILIVRINPQPAQPSPTTQRRPRAEPRIRSNSSQPTLIDLTDPDPRYLPSTSRGNPVLEPSSSASSSYSSPPASSSIPNPAVALVPLFGNPGLLRRDEAYAREIYIRAHFPKRQLDYFNRPNEEAAPVSEQGESPPKRSRNK